MMHSALETLKTWITESNKIVFFGGAGVSTESGIPDFRSVDGLYHQKFICSVSIDKPSISTFHNFM